MSEKIQAELLYEEIFEILSNEENRIQQFTKLTSLLNQIIKQVSSESNIYFGGQYAKIYYLSNKFSIDKKLRNKLLSYRRIVKSNKNEELEDLNKLYDFAAVICNVIKIVYQIEPNTELEILIHSENANITFEELNAGSQSELLTLKAIVIEKGDYFHKSEKQKEKAILKCTNDEYGDFDLVIYKDWIDFWNVAEINDEVYLINVKNKLADLGSLYTTAQSYLVLDPNLLIDATDISECYSNRMLMHCYLFLKKFKSFQSSAPLVYGNIANTFFDEILTAKFDNNEPKDFEEIFQAAMRQKVLSLFAMEKNKPGTNQLIKNDMRAFYESATKSIELISKEEFGDKLTVEAFFLSPKYGIQGRLDAFFEFENNAYLKNIIELKSGKPTDGKIKISDSNGNLHYLDVWRNHQAQATCYNLLLDSTYEDRKGNSQILYIKDSRKPLRDTINQDELKRELVIFRNRAISIEKKYISGELDFLQVLELQLKEYGKMDFNDFETMWRNFKSLPQLKRDYFHYVTRYLLKEIYSSKTGDFTANENQNFAELWENEINEKRNSISAICDLELMNEESDFDRFYLHFQRKNESNPLCVIRKNDQVILYPITENESLLLKEQVLKASVKSITNERIIVSLRNKKANENMLNSYNSWCIESDNSESNARKLLADTYSFICSQKSDIILGLEQPEFEENEYDLADNLDYWQKIAITKSLNAKDYFLIQGPPGTGKTSYVLQNIVEQIIENSEETILLLAYTNRAANEICKVINDINSKPDFLRLGNKDSADFKQNMISWQVEDIEVNLRDLHKRIKSCRIFVSTVLGAITNKEILEIKKFDTIILDEASQVLEPQVTSLLSLADRFIMIGDEKQLPAITRLSNTHLIVENELLNEIELKNLGESLFERLLRLSKINNWDCSIMLRRQARMHNNIMHIANKNFYQFLEVFQDLEWQNMKSELFDEENVLSKALKNNRVIFIESKAERILKINRNEVNLTLSLIDLFSEKMKDNFNENSIGVISPFRLQCAEIAKNLNEEHNELITIDTIERFQGSERDVIIISFACDFPNLINSIQSLTEIDNMLIDRKLNVAITRARQHLILIGNRRILEQSPIYSKIINSIPNFTQAEVEEILSKYMY